MTLLNKIDWPFVAI